VLEELDVRESIARAWAMLRERLGPLALVWAALLGITICSTIVIGLPLILAMIALLAIALLTVLISPLLYVALVVFIGLLTWLVASAIGGIVETFVSAAWTLTYRDLTGMGLTGEEAPSIT
jgi:hypothetical protein